MKTVTLAAVCAGIALALVATGSYAQSKGESRDYPSVRGGSSGPVKSRAQVKAELDMAKKSGDVHEWGEEDYINHFAKTGVVTKSRAEVKADLAEARKSGKFKRGDAQEYIEWAYGQQAGPNAKK